MSADMAMQPEGRASSPTQPPYPAAAKSEWVMCGRHLTGKFPGWLTCQRAARLLSRATRSCPGCGLMPVRPDA